MYYVMIVNGKIVQKHSISINIELEDGEKKVTKEIYEQITRLPADFETDTEGNIISVTPAPEPEPTSPEPSVEEYLVDLDFRLSKMELGL